MTFWPNDLLIFWPTDLSTYWPWTYLTKWSKSPHLTVFKRDLVSCHHGRFHNGNLPIVNYLHFSFFQEYLSDLFREVGQKKIVVRTHDLLELRKIQEVVHDFMPRQVAAVCRKNKSWRNDKPESFNDICKEITGDEGCKRYSATVWEHPSQGALLHLACEVNVLHDFVLQNINFYIDHAKEDMSYFLGNSKNEAGMLRKHRNRKFVLWI